MVAAVVPGLGPCLPPPNFHMPQVGIKQKSTETNWKEPGN